MTASDIIASIIGVASDGFRLSLLLNAYSTDLRLAHSIARGVSSYSLTLKHVGHTLQQQDNVQSEAAIHAAKSIADESKLVFDEIEHSLVKVQQAQTNGSISPSQRFTWYFKRGKVAYLLAALESLQLSLSLILQVIHLGLRMSLTSKSDTHEEVIINKNAIQQERAEVQNLIILRYWQIQEVEHLYHEAQREELEENPPDMVQFETGNQALLTNGVPQLAIEAPPEEEKSLVQLPVNLLGELEHNLEPIRSSPKDMLRTSDAVIDPLLESWTIWHEMREKRHARNSSNSSRYAPSVQDLPEDGERDDDYHDQDSPRGHFLEGSTTNWRQPHSAKARSEAVQQRKRWSALQASVSAESSDADESPGSKTSRRKAPTRHILDSGSSDSSEDELPARPRRSSGGQIPAERRSTGDMPPTAHSYTAGQTRNPVSGGGFPSPRPPMPPSPQVHRPGMHHATTSPLPPINTNNPPNPYVPGYPTYQTARYAPRMAIPVPRPVSRDGKPRSPSRLGPSAPLHRRNSHEERKGSKKTTGKNLREGATKGILGAGAIGAFLEALEGLSL